MKYISSRGKSLGLTELIAIAVGGMVGGGIFSILGISAEMIGFVTPVAIFLGGILALMAAYSYVKLGVYYKDEGASYAFVKRTFPGSHKAAAVLGWLVIFGYISTLSLYSYTFASYANSQFSIADNEWMRKLTAWSILLVFYLINIWSVKGMGKIEDLMVYTKLLILLIISVLFITHGRESFGSFMEKFFHDVEQTRLLAILIVASITFVSYEGFQLVINAVNEMTDPDRNIPRAIYGAIVLVITIYLVLAFGALFAIPLEDLIRGKEYALASGASQVIGKAGELMVIFGALLATSSAISGTVFGSSRQMAAIAEDGYFPKALAKRNRKNIPYVALTVMVLLAALLILIGGLRLILEFGSITFILVSLIIAYTNYVIRDKTGSGTFQTLASITGLTGGVILILYYELKHKPEQMAFIAAIYVILGTGAYLYAKRRERLDEQKNSD